MLADLSLSAIQRRLLRRLFGLAKSVAARFGVCLELSPSAQTNAETLCLRHPVTAMLCGMSLDASVTIVIVGAGHVSGGTEVSGGFDPGLEFTRYAPHRITRCVLVEPLQERLNALKDIVPSSVHVDFIESAVSREDKLLSLWVVSPAAQAKVRRVEERMGVASSGGLGWTSTSRHHVMKLLQAVLLCSFEEMNSFVVERKVRSATLTQILVELGVRDIDYLQIDVEGADSDVIRSLDLNRFRPKLLCFESAHLSVEARREILAHLTGYEYSEFEGLSSIDTVVGLSTNIPTSAQN